MAICKFNNECPNFFGENGKCKTGCIHNEDLRGKPLPNMLRTKFETQEKDENPSPYWDEPDIEPEAVDDNVMSVREMMERQGHFYEEKDEPVIRKFTDLTEEELFGKTNADLQDLLSENNLNTYGNKNTLVARLLGQTE